MGSRSHRARAVTGAWVALTLAALFDCKPPDKNGAFGELAAKTAAGCCTDFRVGYDMLVTDFGVDPTVRAPYNAYAQTMGDYVVLSTRMLDEVTGACRSLAVAFGANEADTTVTKGRSGSDATYAWCNLAARRMADAFGDSLRGAGRFSTHYTPTTCAIDTSLVSRCEQACSTELSCQEPPLTDRCAKEATVGTCTGKCTGTCEGSAAVPAACDGTCDGTCEGGCYGGCYGLCEGQPTAGRPCRGICVGTCDAACKGKCTGACHPTKTSQSRCDGPCKGGCSTPYASAQCEADLAPPKCPVNAECEANCKALGQARASCTAPALSITLNDDVPKETTSDLAIQTKLRILEHYLPRLVNAAETRGPLLEAEIKAAYDAGETVVADKNRGLEGKLGVKGSACALVIEAAGQQAATDFHVASEAAKAVLKTLPTPK